MRAPPHAGQRLAAACALAALCACGSEPHSLRWQIAFESRALGRRAALVESRILKGGCNGDEILYVSEFAPDETGTRPPELERGSYGLIARAQDESCFWYAQGCTEVRLPRTGEPVTVMLSPLDDETLDCDGCDAERCRGGAGAMDGGMDARVPQTMRDAEVDDAGGVPADEDGGDEPDVPVEQDAAPPPEPVTISLEAELGMPVDPPFVIEVDDLASGGAYIWNPWNDELTTEENQAAKRATPPADDMAGGIAFYDFEVPRGALYRFWGKVITPSLDTDSFWFRIDDGDWIQWNDISHQDQTWHWDDLRPFETRADRHLVPLEPGSHRLRVSYRELGAKLDRIIITSELDWVPAD